jgi:hypothetical protein
MKEFLEKLGTDLETNKSATVSLNLLSNTSGRASVTYNESLGERRLESMKKFILSFPKVKKASDQNRLTFVEKNFGENGDVVSFDANANRTVKNQGSCTNTGDEIYTTRAMACRRTTIEKITVTTTTTPEFPNPGPVPQPNNDPQPQLQPIPQIPPTTQIEQKYIQRDNITKRVLRALLSECDYFETIKTETPMVYDNLKDKLKFFQPAFHSTTPEGLNSRLTFLQQCMRPGDTIPTIKDINGATELQYNNATNTAFGTPPVLVLRVGDFYNTKIIPTSLSLTFEGLDINPEGIGVQPMIANVSMNFNFVGGSGLAQAVDKLQNALSFNYYANTEMWDDRADVTDTSIKVLDKNFLQSIGNPPPPLSNQVQNNYTFSNTNTIGKRLTSQITSTDEFGDISYKEFMDGFVGETRNYFQTIMNKEKQVLQQYNNAMLQLWSLQRIYQKGTFYVEQSMPEDVYIFGKPDNIQKLFNPFFDEYETAINTNSFNNQDGFITFISKPQKSFTPKTIRQIKRNYTTFIKNKKSAFLTPLSNIIQEVTNQQQNYLQFIARANTVPLGASAPGTGTDGYQEQNMTIRVFETSGTTKVAANAGLITNTLDEMIEDIKTIRKNLIEFQIKTNSSVDFDYGGQDYQGFMIYGMTVPNSAPSPTIADVIGQVFVPFNLDPNPNFDNSDFLNKQFKRMYLLCSQDLKTDNYESFKNAIIGNLKNAPEITVGGADYRQIEAEFDAYWKVMAKSFFDKETAIATKFLETMETSDTQLKTFINYNPFPSKERVLTYKLFKPPLSSQTTMIKSLGASTNLASNKQTWNDEVSTNAWVSKIKLN